MISVTITKDRNGIFKQLECNGHAGFDEYGKDIVCSAVSMLVINTINSIEEIAGCDMNLSQNPDDGYILMSLKDGNSEDSVRDASLFADSLILGLKGVIKEYGKKYVSLVIKEV